MKQKSIRTQRPWIRLCVFLAAGLALALLPVWAHGADGPVFTAQAKDVEVNYPDGASFHVEVAEPENVASWQWIASDGHSEFTLTGVTAKTDTLVIPATMQDDPEMFYCCVVTDKNGGTATSDPVRLHVKNPEEDKTVLFVGDYAVEPGEKLDLAETTLGSGTVDFAADGVNVTFQSVKIDNTTMTCDSTLTPSMGLYLVRRHSTDQEYYFHFKGDCLVNNTYYDPAYNAGGVAINSYFGTKDDPNAPTIIFDGDGKLTVRGGTNQIYSDGNIELAADLTTGVNGTYFNDGISCKNLFIDKGVKANLTVNGTAIHTEGDFRIYEGAALNIRSSSPHVSVGPTTKSMMFLVGSLYGEGGEINIQGYADPENFVPYDAFVATMPGILLAGEGSINADGTAISVELSAGESEEDFAINFYGVYGAGETNAVSLSNGAKLDVRIQTPQVNGVSGVVVPGIFAAEKDCQVRIDVLGSGEVTGLEADRAFSVTDAVIESKAISESGDAAFGIVCGEAAIALNGAKYSVHSTAKDGVAFAADTGEHGDAEISYVSGYTPVKIVLKDNVACTVPENGEINLCGIPGYGGTIQAETFYGSDKTRPAAEVTLSSTAAPAFVDVADQDWFHDAVQWAVSNKITNGTDDTHFSPSALCTRAQMVTFLWRAAGSPASEGELIFSDVDSGAYYADAVRWAAAEKIVMGTTETTFSPNAPVSREQLATFIYRVAQADGQGFTGAWAFLLDFEDADQVSSWADEGVHWCVMKKILTGTGQNKLSPKGTATRAQIVTMLYRYFVPVDAG